MLARLFCRVYCTARRHPAPALRTVGTCRCGRRLYYWRLA